MMLKKEKQNIFQKAIIKSEKGGYQKKTSDIWSFIEGEYIGYDMIDIESVIFSHSFAKAFFGSNWIGDQWGCEEWKYRLKEMVLEEDPIKYLETYLE